MKIGPVDPEIALLNASKIYSRVGSFAEQAKKVIVSCESHYKLTSNVCGK